MKYYNAGRDGCSIFYHYAILKGVLKRYNPKLIIYDFSSEEFNYYNKSYDVLSSLLPYFKSNSEIHDIVLMRGKFEKLKLISNIYPYNSLVLSILGGNIGNSIVIDDNKGYIPLTKVWNEPLGTYNNTNTDSIDNNKIIYFKNFIKDCANRGIKIAVIRSPRFRKDIPQSKSLEIAKGICSDYKINFFDFSNDTMFLNHSNYFQDIAHLNDSGAKIFSKQVVDKLIAEQILYANNR